MRLKLTFGWSFAHRGTRVREGRGKPAPDIYRVALQALNSAADLDEKLITPNERLVWR